MKKQQLATLNMANRLKNFLNGIDPTILALIPMVVLWFNQIKVLLLALEAQLQAFDALIEGFSNTRKTAREALVQAAINLAAQVQSYANSIDDMTLYGNMDFTKTLLDRCSSVDLKAITKNIGDTANLHLAELAPFGVTAISMTQYAQTRTDYAVADPKPEEARLLKQASTLALKVGLTEIMALYVKIDRGMRGARIAHPILVSDYFRARKIIDLPKRTYAVIGEVINGAGVPMPFVTLTCATLNLKRKTTRKGGFIIKNGTEEQHELIFTFPGYKKVSVMVTITHGVRAKIVVIMDQILEA